MESNVESNVESHKGQPEDKTDSHVESDKATGDANLLTFRIPSFGQVWAKGSLTRTKGLGNPTL